MALKDTTVRISLGFGRESDARRPVTTTLNVYDVEERLILSIDLNPKRVVDLLAGLSFRVCARVAVED